MKLALYAREKRVRSDERYLAMVEQLCGHELIQIDRPSELEGDVDMVLSLGGDGTFLSIAGAAAHSAVPVLGVNFGRLGFLSEYRSDEVAASLTAGAYEIEDREMLESSVNGSGKQVSLNEISVTRIGSAMMGIDVSLNGTALPTYWADGLIVATSSGSTAYSLSVGGPICTPDSKVLIISPIAPHNLNVRPLIVPSSSQISISLQSRDPQVRLTRDNTAETFEKGIRVDMKVAQFSLKRVRLKRSNFIEALRGKLFWGEDVRNSIR